MRAVKFQRWGLVVGLASAGLGQAPAWTWVGPAALTTPPPISASFAGPMAALALPPNAPAGTMLAGGVGGVWRLQGGAWQPLSPGQAVSALAISSDGSTIYAGSGDRFDAATRAGGGVWASSDGGGTWSRDGAATLGGLAIAALAADPAQPGHVLAAAVVAADSPAGVQPGVYATSDGGATWALALDGTFTTLSWQGGAVLAAGPTGVDLSLTAELKFPNGILGIIDCSFEQPFRCTYELVGTQGSIVVPDAYLPPETGSMARVMIEGETRELEFENTNQYAAMVDSFGMSVASGVTLLPPSEDGLAQSEVLDAILAAAHAA